MAAISAFHATIVRFFHFSLEIEFNALRFISYTIPRLCSTYAVAAIYGSPFSNMVETNWVSLQFDRHIQRQKNKVYRGKRRNTKKVCVMTVWLNQT